MGRFSSLINWFSNGVLCGPSAPNSVPECLVRNSKMLRPPHNRFRRAIESNQAIGATIVSLLLPGRPAAILLAVAFVVVFAVKSGLGWSSTHVRKEGVKAVEPFIADGYASSSIMLPISGCGIRAPLDHGVPCPEFRDGLSASVVPMNHVCLCSRFTLKASARPCFTALQRARLDDLCISAVALAKPSNLSTAAVFCPVDYNETRKSRTTQIGNTCHGILQCLQNKEVAGRLELPGFSDRRPSQTNSVSYPAE